MTPEQIEKHRKRFEDLFKACGTGHTLELNSFNQYASHLAQFMWQGYLMHADNQEVELPKEMEVSGLAIKEKLGHNNCLREIKYILESQGIKIKSSEVT